MLTKATSFLGRTVLNWRRTELNYILEFLKDKKKKRILEYGCNTADILKRIRITYTNSQFDLYGADINAEALSMAQQKTSTISFIQINEKNEEFLSTEKFDIVILSHVLEHIKDRNELVGNMRKILKKTGTLIIVVPQERIRGDCNIPQIMYNFARLHFENPHVVKLHYPDIQSLLKSNGFEITDYTYSNFFYPFRSKKKRLDTGSLLVICKKMSHTFNAFM